MSTETIFCNARNVPRLIALESCVPNPLHPACRSCASPNITKEHADIMKEFVYDDRDAAVQPEGDPALENDDFENGFDRDVESEARDYFDNAADEADDLNEGFRNDC